MASTIKPASASQPALLLSADIDELSIVNAITKLIFAIDEPLTPLEREVLSLLPVADSLFVDCQPQETAEYLRTFAKWELMNLVERLKILLMIDPELENNRRVTRPIIYQH